MTLMEQGTASIAGESSAVDPVFDTDPSVRARRRERWLVAVARVLVAVIWLGSWQLASGRLASSFWISSPSGVWHALVSAFGSGHLLTAVGVTMQETLVGFAIGASAGIAVGVVLGISRVLARVLDPYLVALNSVPRIALVPLLILWFGIGFETKIVFASLLVFFPVFMNTMAGVRDVDRDLIDVLNVMGAKRREILTKVIMPSSLVWVFAGLRISIPFALLGAVVSEMFAGNTGLGAVFALASNTYNTSEAFAVLFVITLLGLLITTIVDQLERRLLRWQRLGD